MTPDYVLQLGWSRSTRYAQARAWAEAAPGATVTGAGTAVTVRLPLRDLPPRHVLRLLQRAKTWKGTALRLEDTPLPQVALWQLESTAACAVERELGGAGPLHCWGLTEGSPRSVPCRLLAGLVADWRDGGPVAMQAAALHAAARTRTVAVCPFYDPAAIAAALAAGADRQEPIARQIPAAWQRWVEAQTAARLLAAVDLGLGPEAR